MAVCGLHTSAGTGVKLRHVQQAFSFGRGDMFAQH